MRSGRTRQRGMILAALAVVSGLAFSGLSALGSIASATTTHADNGAQTLTFPFTGGPQVFIIPLSVRSVNVEVDGGEGASANGASGGKGATVKAALAVEPGGVLQINVGAAGAGRSGGWNGGGAGGEGSYSNDGGGGGGASDVLAAPFGTANRILVAGGGAGAGAAGGAGGKGGLNGETGGAASRSDIVVGGGDGGTQAGPGAAGRGTNEGKSGSPGNGVNGGTAVPGTNGRGGGGGGGGYYGGGAGATCLDTTRCNGAGGGGGSSFGPAGKTTVNAGAWSGKGRVVITYQGPLRPSIKVESAKRVYALGEQASFTAVVARPDGTDVPLGSGGTVTFYDNGGDLYECVAVPLKDGRAACKVTSLTVGNRHIVAHYNGDASYEAAYSLASPAVTVFHNRAVFEATGAAQAWTVPPAVTSIQTWVLGAQGGGDRCTTGKTDGADGGRTISTVSVTPGRLLQFNVGRSGASGGWNGGGAKSPDACGGTGGGASDIRTAPYELANRLVVAGGGGAAAVSPGGIGGGPTGGPGEPVRAGATGGGGGTQTSGGTGGTPGGSGSPSATPGGDGSLGSGGSAGKPSHQGYASGGGGGGYYGGGGGGGGQGMSGAGGGGGSSFGPAGTTFENGVSGGNGTVSVYFNGGSVQTTTELTSSQQSPKPGVKVQLKAKVSTPSWSPPPFTFGAATVAFSDGSTAIPGCSSVLANSAGQATCSYSAKEPGTHQLSAEFKGNTLFTASTGHLALLVAATEETFVPTGQEQTFVAPEGVKSIVVQVYGAQGAAGCSTGGLGGYASATLAVHAGERIAVFVGSKPAGGGGGHNGGGSAGASAGPPIGTCPSPGGGGGGSDVRVGGSSLAQRVLVAGGGGGGSNGDGANGGGTQGAGSSGGGGTAAAGGGGGGGMWAGGAAGVLGAGGNGGGSSSPGAGGGGGGGGYYGGGGGGSDAGSGGGGGGGSGYGIVGSILAAGINSGNGKVEIGY